MGLVDIVLGPALEIIKRFVPDPVKQAEMQLELAKLDVNLVQGQLDINKAEASSVSTFTSGWRPAIGWIGAAALAYQYIGQPLLEWASLAWQFPAPPKLEMSDLIMVVTGMLGLGGFRTIERIKGRA